MTGRGRAGALSFVCTASFLPTLIFSASLFSSCSPSAAASSHLPCGLPCPARPPKIASQYPTTGSRCVHVRSTASFLSVLVAYAPAPRSSLRSFVVAPTVSRRRLINDNLIPTHHQPPCCNASPPLRGQRSFAPHRRASQPACSADEIGKHGLTSVKLASSSAWVFTVSLLRLVLTDEWAADVRARLDRRWYSRRCARISTGQHRWACGKSRSE